MKEKEPIDLAFQEVTRDKGGIRSKIAKTSRNLVFNYSQSNAGTVATGVAIDSLGIGSFVGAMESQPELFLPALVLSGLGTAIAVSPLIPGWLDCLSRDEDHKRIYEKVVSTVSRVYPEWQNNPPSKEEFEAFIKKVLYLPPVGGKVTLDRNSLRPTALFPALTVDEKVEEIIKFRQNGELDSAYVHQLTVQGKLPDEFKYAALALIINSTYRSDWKKPFYEASWAKVAPLIHGGDDPVININPLWRSKGRTDFLQRVATVYEPELENMEQYVTPQLATRFSSEDLANAVLEQNERRRLILEINFYQRAAFGLHAKIGTLPNAVPPDVAMKGIQAWEGFVKGMDNILDDYDASKITKPRWFTKMPRFRAWGGLGLRYEANYSPIQEALTFLEEIKSKNPSLRRDVNLLMTKTVRSIDNAIGI